MIILSYTNESIVVMSETGKRYEYTISHHNLLKVLRYIRRGLEGKAWQVLRKQGALVPDPE